MLKLKGWRMYGTYHTAEGKIKSTNTACICFDDKMDAVITFWKGQTEFVRKTLRVYVSPEGMTEKALSDNLIMIKADTDSCVVEKFTDSFLCEYYRVIDLKQEKWKEIDIFAGLEDDARRAAKTMAFGKLYGGSWIPTHIGLVAEPADGFIINKIKKDNKMKVNQIKVGDLFTVGHKSHNSGRSFTDSGYVDTIFIAVSKLTSGVYGKPVYGYWKNIYGDEKDIFFESLLFDSAEIITPSEFRKITGTIVDVKVTEPKIHIDYYRVSRGNYRYHPSHDGNYIVSLYKTNRGNKVLIRFYGENADEHLAMFLLNFLKDKEVQNSTFDGDRVKSFEVVTTE